ncbi:MAG: YHS domain-containing protein, partial [Marmoricola sp.]
MSHVHEDHNFTASPVVKDPVCGMDVDPSSSEHHVERDGAAYHFCSAHCQARFEADPAQYVGAQPGGRTSPAGPDAGSAGQEHTCPMHPEIRQLGPGACPICGMALEPVMVSADSGPSAELADMT